MRSSGLLIWALLVQMVLAQQFAVGQRVTFQDVYSRYGGGTILGTIIQDRGPGYTSRYIVQVDGRENDLAFGQIGMSAQELQPAGPAPGTPAANPAPAAQPPVAAPPPQGDALAVGQRVTFQDAYARYGGGTVFGTIIADRGPGYTSRYIVQVDGRENDVAFGQIGMSAQELRPAGSAPAAQAQAARPVAVAAQPAQAATPAQAAPPRAVPQGWGQPPPRGSFKYGKPNLQTMLGRKALTPPGLKELFVGTPPGDESAVGRWYTRTGGVWNKDGSAPDLDGNQSYEWDNPEVAELIKVNADGSWEMNDHGKVTTGKWYDIGQNVIRLVNLDDGVDWTASVYDKMIQFKSEQGITKEGNRY